MFAVGIDLGKTKSCVAVCSPEGLEIIPNQHGYNTTPSVVSITDEEIRVGNTALLGNARYSQNLVYDTKRMIGKLYSDNYLQSDISALKWSFKVDTDSHDHPLIHIPNLTKRKKYYSPEEISSFILKAMKNIVEEFHLGKGKTFSHVVITVPAYFNDLQRKATVDAANLAGLNVIQLLTEPAAAVLAYYYHRLNEIYSKKQNILVYDLGGGTFDVSIMQIYNSRIDVKGFNGDTHLGGNDFDARLIDYFITAFKDQTGEDIHENRKALWKIRLAAIKAKEVLSLHLSYEVSIDSLQNDEDFKYEILRTEFEYLCQDLFDRTLEIVDKTLKDTNFHSDNIDNVLLIGGSTRIPKLEEMLSNKFGKNKINKTINGQEVVAYGAAIQAAMIAGKNIIKGPFLFHHPKYYKLPDKIVSNNYKINVVGVDLGTSRCCAGVNRKSGIETVALDNSDRLLPSYVAYDEEKEKCGKLVVDRLRNYSESTIFDSKRIIGKNFDEIVIDPFWPFKVLNIEDQVFLEIESHSDKKMLNAVEVSAALLKHTKRFSEEFQGRKFDKVVITIPAAFTKAQQEATLTASKLAGWIDVELLPEPIAATFAYFAEHEIPNDSTLFLFDLGGGTLDVCIFKIQRNRIYIISNTGDTKLGGRDFDALLINYFNNMLKSKYDITVMKGKIYRLMQSCEKIKEQLTYMDKASLDVEEFDASKEGMIDLSRETFEIMAKELLDKIKNTIHAALYNSGIQKNEINKVLQVGGGSRMPMIKNLLHDIFPKSIHVLEKNPDEVVAIGAAYYAYSRMMQ